MIDLTCIYSWLLLLPTKVDDTSPLIQYAPAGVWGDSSHSDPFWQSYSNGTFHPTNYTGATATLTFNGSAVYLYGAFRGNHDQYSVTLDGTTTVKNGYSNGEKFQQLMFSATNLNNVQHQLVLKNTYTTTGPSWVDVDYILVTSGDGDAT
ncbi:hypothetical protein BDY19DRAFT_886314 [Irpex rosettiformis]|uniref:Uncharacterized protein n=1 Tax=Irpex rosettiformis TaxID=378272 RepID=A0ACB8UA38_9APHY|nr:hypothetical protein BDY19DRAFT_886314 [Irpex rosettiformis]